ncbi:MAG: hypothetical protein ABW190_01845 [Rhizobacter sp.]
MRTDTLRALTIEPRDHPRGVAHLAAASGLVCAFGRAYVVCDDEHQLAVFDHAERPGRLHRLLPGDLPADKTERKRRKADFEALLLCGERLVAFGSGSTPQRDTGVVLTLDPHGEPTGDTRPFDLSPLYRPLRAALGEINIEGAFLLGDELVLLHRGGQGQSRNAVVRYGRAQLLAVIDGRRGATQAPRITPFDLGQVNGVPLGFTDGAALSNGAWVFCAAAEDTADSYADGPCAGSVVGLVDARGRLVVRRELATLHKPEGIAARGVAGRIELCLVTDADDPARCAELLRASL